MSRNYWRRSEVWFRVGHSSRFTIPMPSIVVATRAPRAADHFDSSIVFKTFRVALMWAMFSAYGARAATGTIQDVEHVVILMQENRSFDHYFGSMKAVRGFNDRNVLQFPN